MKKVLYEKAIRYSKKDVIVQSDYLKTVCESYRGKDKYGMLRLIADEVAMPMGKVKETLLRFFDKTDYLRIMHQATIYVIEYGDDENEETED